MGRASSWAAGLTSGGRSGMVAGVKTAGMKTAEVRAARQLFLFGAGDGRPVRHVATLAKAAGVHIQTIQKHLPAWEAEAEEILSNSSEIGFRLRLNAETLKKHESDKAFIRRQIDLQVLEIERLPVLEKQLLSIADACAKSQSDSGAAEAVLALVQSFVGLHGSRKAAEAHLLKLQSHWSKMAGVESLQAVAETREKTLATGRAKLALRREEAEGMAGDGSQARPVGSGAAGGVFAKRAVAPVVELVGDDEV